jgi:predicted nucleic acid-binding protein
LKEVRATDRHELCTSALTYYEVEEAVYKVLRQETKGIEQAGRLCIPAARSVVPQVKIMVEMFCIQVLELSSSMVDEQLRERGFEIEGVRAADSLHLTTALKHGADLFISGDGHLLTLDSKFDNSVGKPLRVVDTGHALGLLRS